MKEHIPLLFLSSFSFLLLTTLPKSNSQEQESTTKYSNCTKPFNCGSVSRIVFPFWDDVERPRYCGGRDEFKLSNCIDPYPLLHINSQQFQVININFLSYTMKMVRKDVDYESCDHPLSNNTLSPTLFQYTQNVDNITVFYDCHYNVSFPKNFTCLANYHGEYVFYGKVNEISKLEERCENRSIVQVLLSAPLEPSDDFYALKEVVEKGFEVSYDTIEEDALNCKRCRDSDGACGRIDIDQYQFSCHCPDGSQSSSQCQIHTSYQWNWKRKVTIGVIAGLSGFIVCIIIICCSRSKSSTWKINFWMTTKGDQDVEAFLKKHGDLNLKRYKFSAVKKMTNTFKEKLGQGGFGAVYKGKLLTGCPVAVKILNASKKNGADFINEVASISRTSHVNVVALLGFSFEGQKKALIYEFMANGSLEKFVYKNVGETTPSLSWEILNDIAKGIARGLEYLHRGCNTRILHFDIKPHNILLDENFCPKISDFGLAKLCPRNESIISMSDARGTIGYVAPEVWNRHFGGVSHKSDVYSYGMMLLEMVGGRKNINAEASHSSEIYFPHWIYKKLEVNGDLGLNGAVATTEDEIAKRLTLVGLWCIQTFPNDRPTISKVIEMLEGNMNSLEVPPKPVLSSPTRSVPESSTT
ncbi:PREDICTED: LEAF RUST 10 DISEASE-RESISTANCE LOCUS RECEPTOR-LIKE PROTEIN KINASE-like 2.4 [Lupinus angustifolius]|uniref:LEAF RUST 10 DISEASE-RESISTANCE LOCUS RECEPTOR-LIKE PROTEIN KINASE-like 2.4 n=1 Tax=Lupinus angustifolius TaxID=3871 RepID=UPI00092E2909|nr:PREDICTED: LEAF RUST 10 DISEASE-RESISTANCE LOCUS RECEPTOR-LIKE PROTEIN KINASE-like 2.4 [Lupinus angustifolius]